MSKQIISAEPLLSIDFTVFESTPGMRFLLSPNAPQFTIVAATECICKHVGLTRKQLVGKSIFEAFPSNPSDPGNTGERDLRASLEHVLLHNEPHQLPLQRYDIQEENGSFTKRYWKVGNYPVITSEGQVNYIIHVTEDFTKQVEADEMKVKRKDLEQAYNSFLQAPIVIDDTVSGVFTISNDVTLKVLAEKKAEESEDRFRVLADQAPVMVFIADTNAAVTFWNKYWLEYTGQSYDEALGRAWEATVHPDDYENLLNTYIKATNEQKSYSAEARMRRFDGEYRYFQFNGGPRYASNGILLGNVGTGIDVHDRKKAEDALKKNELNLRNTILKSPVAMAILRGTSHIVEIANDRMYELWGRGKEQLLNKSIFEGLPEVKDQGYEELLNAVLTTGERFTATGIPVTLPRSSGIETVYINLLYEAYREADGTVSGIMVVAMDVTDQVLARMTVEESNKEFQFVTDFMPQMIWVTRPDGYHYYYNKQWYDYTGLTYEETIGDGWNNVFHPDDRDQAWKQWRHSLQTGESYEIEYRCRRFDGQYRWVLGRALPLKNDFGNILKWFGTCTDIHDQKIEAQLLEEKVKERTRELESQKKELERSNAHLEEFAYAASHDLKEPIRKIKTFSQRLRQRLQDRLLAEDEHYFERMESATDRMESLIDDLLDYSHVSTSNNYSDKIDLNKKVAKVLLDLELEIAEKNATVIVDVLPVISGNRRQMQQLFQNLIINALKFRKPNVSPEIRISSTVVMEENEAVNINDESKGQMYYLIEVADNGIGFEQEYAEMIFKMFQRLHGRAEYEGTGIGLAIVKKVVENHKGFIRAESKPGEGAKFKVYLPVGS